MKRPAIRTPPATPAPAKPRRARARADQGALAESKAQGPMMRELHRRAEAQLRARAQDQPAGTGRPKQSADQQRQLHELQVHQVELEVQNTELQEARDRTEVLLEKYADLFDFAPAGYFSLGENGRILEVNLNGAAMLGTERARLINRLLASFAVPAGRAPLAAFLKKVFSGIGKQACEATLQRADGTTFWASFQGISALTANGRLKWCRLAVSDITALKQAETILRRNEALFTALIQQAPVGVYVVDDQLRLQEANPQAQAAFRKFRPLLGRNLSDIVRTVWPRRIAREIMEHFRDTLQSGQPYASPEFRARRRDNGKTEFHEWQIQRVSLPSGKHGVACFFTNITERKEAEEAGRRLEVLAASNRKLEAEILHREGVEKSLTQTEQHQRELLAQSQDMQKQLRQLSHQILSAQEEERKKISRELHDEIAQTLAGINTLLNTLKAEVGRHDRVFQDRIARTQRLVKQSVEIVHRFARDLRPALLDDLGLIPALHAFTKIFNKQTGLRVRITVFAGVEKLGNATRTVLYRVAQEALTNVARHARAHDVAINIQPVAGRVRMTIQDDGQGPTADLMQKALKGKRLGLIGMRERLEMVGGHLEIHRVKGQGTTVRAEVPMHDSRRPAAGARAKGRA